MANEDIKNDYTEVDVAGDHINADTANDRADFVNMPLDVEVYFYKDFTASHFANFEHLMDFYLTSANSAVSICGYSVATTLEDLSRQTDAFQVYMYGITTPNYRIYIRDVSDLDADYVDISTGTSYYLKITRTGTTWTVNVYDDSERTNEIANSPIAVTGTGTAFRYVLVGQSDDESSSGTRQLTGYMEHLDLQEAAGETILPQITSAYMRISA